MPTKDELNGLVGYVVGDKTFTTSTVKVEYCQQENVFGFKFTGVQPGYTRNSIFLPAVGENMICRQVTVIIGHPIRMKAPITAVHYLYYMLKVWVCTLILLTLLMPQKTSMRYAPYSDK